MKYEFIRIKSIVKVLHILWSMLAILMTETAFSFEGLSCRCRQKEVRDELAESYRQIKNVLKGKQDLSANFATTIRYELKEKTSCQIWH